MKSIFNVFFACFFFSVCAIAAEPQTKPAPATQPAATTPEARDGKAPARQVLEQRIVNDVIIEQAFFGSGTHLADVTDRVVQLLRAEPLGFAAQGDWLHADPAPGKNKSLLIKYVYRDKARLFMVTGANRASYSALIAVEE
jgi:hypothetical protein